MVGGVTKTWSLVWKVQNFGFISLPKGEQIPGDWSYNQACNKLMDGVTVGTEVAVRRTMLATVAASCSGSHPLRSKDCRPHSKGSWRFSGQFKLGEPEGCPFELKNGPLFVCKIGEIIASNSQDVRTASAAVVPFQPSSLAILRPVVSIQSSLPWTHLDKY